MIGFLRRKLWKNKWLTLCLLIGNVLLIGIVMASPLFTTATRQRILQEDMRRVQQTQNTFPAIMQLRYSLNSKDGAYQLMYYHNVRGFYWPQVANQMGVPLEKSIITYLLRDVPATPYVQRDASRTHRTMNVAGVEGFAENITLVHGRMPSSEMAVGNVMEVLASTHAMHRFNLILDELMVTRQLGPSAETVFVRVVGVFEIAEGSDAFWHVAAANPLQYLLVQPELLYNRFITQFRHHIHAYRLSVVFSKVLDFTAMHVSNVPHYHNVIYNVTQEFDERGRAWNFSVSFERTMDQFHVRTERLSITLWVLQLPLLVMMALYIYMVSRQILTQDKNDISILHSRGASRRQIIGIYIMQGLFVGAVSFPVGMWLGVSMCHVIGGSSGFLELVQREALEVVVTNEALLFGLGAAVFSLITMLLPVIGFSKVSIIDTKRQNYKTKKPMWQRYFLDVVCFVAAVYGLYNFHLQQEQMAYVVADTQFVDPLLFINSSLFIAGAGLLCLRIFPYLVKLVFVIGRRFFSPSVYASMVKVIRSAGEEQFIMLFLVFTVAVGIFSAQTARTINMNNDHRIQYIGGADIMFREVWQSNVPVAVDESMFQGTIPSLPAMVVYTEPDFSRFLNFEEVYHITQVMRRDVSLRARGSTVNDLQLMGIDTVTFGETVWFRNDLLPIHMNYYLNVLASRGNGVLLSDNFRTRMGYSIGDVVTITEPARFGRVTLQETARQIGRAQSNDFVVVGFVEHWPGFAPVERNVLPTGEVQMTETHFAVVNLGQINAMWGMRPYQIWMQTNGATSQFLHDFILDNRIQIAEFNDTISDISAIRSDPVVQGTNGVLTLNFVMTLIVCFTGFLIYWILSIRSRVLQFGIFRAMGMSMRSIISLLVNEQIFITLTALVIGAIVGEVAARLFVPIIQLSYSAADQVIPLIVVMEAQDYASLFGMLGFMLVLCLVILAAYVSRIKVSQALKLGED